MAEKIINDFNNLINEKVSPEGKRKVLIAAIELFSEQGFEKTSTAQISEKSGMSEGTIFKYFKSKKELLNDILTPVINDLLPNYGREVINDKIQNKTSLEDVLKYTIKDRMEFIYLNQNILKILSTEMMVNNTILLEIQNSFKPLYENTKYDLNELLNDTNLTFDEFLRLITGHLLFEFLKMTKFDTENYDLEKEIKSVTKVILNSLN